jgi:hypothetical protein
MLPRGPLPGRQGLRSSGPVFSCDWFEERGIPFVAHKAQVLEGEWLPSEGSTWVGVKIKIEWRGGELLAAFEGAAPFRVQEVWLDDGERAYELQVLVALEDSVLGVLFGLAQRLSERFPWWGARWMPGFVLMGRAPLIGLHQERYYRPNINYHGRGGNLIPQPRLYTPITLEIPPWYSAETVSEIYKRIKNQFLQRRCQQSDQCGAWRFSSSS